MLAMCAIHFALEESPMTNHVAVLRTEFDDPNLAVFSVCNTCSRSLNSKKIPPLARTHGFRYPPKPRGLPNLDPTCERLISPRQPFMQIRRLRHEGSYGIVGQVINVPVDVNNMVRQLPLRLNDDYAFNVNIRKNPSHKSVYLYGFVRKSVVRSWSAHLVNTPLYKHYNIQVDLSVLDVDVSRPAELIFPSMNPCTETPISLCGYFNTGVMQNKSVVNFMKSRFNLDCRSSASTTLGNICMDLTFTRNVSVQTFTICNILLVSSTCSEQINVK
jgi:hypothetical protein